MVTRQLNVVGGTGGAARYNGACARPEDERDSEYAPVAGSGGAVAISAGAISAGDISAGAAIDGAAIDVPSAWGAPCWLHVWATQGGKRAPSRIFWETGWDRKHKSREGSI